MPADNTRINPGEAGDLIATRDIEGVKYQRVQIICGTGDEVVDVNLDSPMPVREKTNVFIGQSLFSEYMTLNNDGTTFDVRGDYSVTPASVRFVPNNGSTAVVNRFLVSLRGDGGWDTVGGYGDVTSPLTNGIDINVRDINGDAILATFTQLANVKTNLDWIDLFGIAAVSEINTPPGVQTAWVLPAQVNDIWPTGFFLSATADGMNGTYLEVLLNDDFTSRIDGTNARQAFRVSGIQLTQAAFDADFQIIGP